MILGNELRMNVLSMMEGAWLIPSEKGINNLRQSLVILKVSEDGLLVESGGSPSPEWFVPFSEVSCKLIVEVVEGLPSSIFVRFEPQDQMNIVRDFIINRFNWLFPRTGKAIGVVYLEQDNPGIAMLDFVAGGWLARSELLKVHCWIESVNSEELFLSVGGKHGETRSMKFRDFKMVIGVNLSGEPPVSVCSIEPQNPHRMLVIPQRYDWLIYKDTPWPIETWLLGHEEGEGFA